MMHGGREAFNSLIGRYQEFCLEQSANLDRSGSILSKRHILVLRSMQRKPIYRAISKTEEQSTFRTEIISGTIAMVRGILSRNF